MRLSNNANTPPLSVQDPSDADAKEMIKHLAEKRTFEAAMGALECNDLWQRADPFKINMLLVNEHLFIPLHIWEWKPLRARPQRVRQMMHMLRKLAARSFPPTVLSCSVSLFPYSISYYCWVVWSRGTNFSQLVLNAVTSTVDHPLGSPSLGGGP
jgi:hypothetical protein